MIQNCGIPGDHVSLSCIVDRPKLYIHYGGFGIPSWQAGLLGGSLGMILWILQRRSLRTN